MNNNIQKWEYRQIVVRIITDSEINLLSECGADGWELIQVLSIDGSYTKFYFKRPIIQTITMRDDPFKLMDGVLFMPTQEIQDGFGMPNEKIFGHITAVIHTMPITRYNVYIPLYEKMLDGIKLPEDAELLPRQTKPPGAS